ncbi:DUF4397 domain-containing protein [candidate division KSB1 bacterium]|nr:MAG: DUF4397 domain-containing protein [candidate division KSB1 bacterium]
MKRIALMLSLFMLVFSISLFAANAEKATVDPMSNENAQKVKPEHLPDMQKNSAKILGETVVFMEDFEADELGWFFDGGYGSLGGDPAVEIIPPMWMISDVKAYSGTKSLFHDDDMDVSRDFAFSPAFTIPEELDGDPVVSAKLSFQINIDNPGYGDPTGTTNNLADYYMVYAGLEETTWSVVDVEGDMVYYSGYPEANSFQFLTSPMIDLTAATAPVALDFKYLMINEIHWDLGRIDVFVDGEEGYTTVGMLNDDSGTWMDMSIDLSAFAGKMVKLRFSFLPDDGTAIEDGGLWLNDIKVSDAVGDIFMDDAEEGNAVMEAFGVTLARLFYDYDRIGDEGADWHLWDENQLYNGTTDLFDVGIQAGDQVWLAFRYVADGDNTQGEEDSDGAFFDDIMVTAISGVAADAGVSDLVIGYPRTKGAPTPFAPTVSNFGFEGQTVALWYDFDGVEMPVPPFLTLDPFVDSIVVFEAKMPVADSTVFTAKTKLTGDMVPENDALSVKLYPDPEDMATFNYSKGGFAYFSTSNRITFYDPLAVFTNVDMYNLESVDIYMYNAAGAADEVNFKVATYDDDPLSPTEVIFDSTVLFAAAGGVVPVSLPVGAMGLTSKVAVWLNYENSAGAVGLLLDDGTPFAGNDLVFSSSQQAWLYSALGHFIYTNITLPTYARLQVVHNAADPAAALVDVYVNDGLLLDDFAFRTATPFIDVPANVELNIGVAPSTSTSVADVIATFPVTFETDGTYVVFANGVLDPTQFAPNPEALDIGFTLMAKAGAREAGMAGDMVDFFVFHGVTDAPAVDVIARDVGAVVEDAAYGDMTDYLSVPAAEYILDVTPADDNETVVASFVADVSGLAGGAAAVFASGFLTPDANQMGEAFGLFVALPTGDVIELLSPSAFKIVIDAEKDAFYDELAGPDDGYLQIRWFAHNNNGKPDNDEDLSAKLWASWDETYLYLYEEVKDNVVNLNNATSWQDDVLEVYVDPDPSAAVTTAQLGFHITALDSADADPAALAGVINLQGYNIETGATTDDYARKRTDDGYVLEVRVAWDSLKDATRSITPAVDNVFGMATMNHDNDVAQREGSVSWAAVLNDNVWNTPDHHATVKFLADNKLQFIPTSTRSGLTNTLPYDGSLPPIMIDAEKDPFYETLTGPDDGYLYIPHQQYNTNGAPDNDLDLSARLWASWDETYLYLYEEVKDQTVNLNNATSWQDDVLEVYVDPNPSADITTAQLGFHITALDSADADPDALAGVINLRGYNIETGATTDDYARKRTSDGYVLEVRVAWDSLKDATRMITPEVGYVFGMATMNHDNDDAQREGSVSFATVLNDNVWNTPANHGTVTFLEDNKLKFEASSVRSGEVNPHPDWYDPATPFNIAMDAVMDPWYNQLTGPDDGYIYIPAIAHNDNGAPDNDKDLSALLWVAWDETYLYFYEEVADNVVNVNNPTSWQNDVLEVYIDPDPTAAVTTSQLGFQMTALDSADADPAALAAVTNLLGYNTETGATTEDYARALTDNGYVLEGRVKWEVLMDATRSITPAAGNIFGMATMNHDNDVSQREGSVSWAAVLLDNVWNTPDHHATVKFLDDHKFQLIAESARSGLANENPDMYIPGDIIKVEVETEEEDVIPEAFNLAQNYPNPFNPTTTIEFALPIDSQVKLTIFDILGREVVTLVDEKMQAGLYNVNFDAARYASGVYFYRLKAGDRIFQKKMMLIK